MVDGVTRRKGLSRVLIGGGCRSEFGEHAMNMTRTAKAAAVVGVNRPPLFESSSHSTGSADQKTSGMRRVGNESSRLWRHKIVRRVVFNAVTSVSRKNK